MAKAKIKTSVKTERVYELAQEFNLSSVAMVEQIRSLGFEVKNHMAICTTPMIEAMREEFDSERQATRQKSRRKDARKKERDILEHTPRVSPRRSKRLLSSKDALAFRLFILKEARNNLVQDLINIKEDPKIHHVQMFEYERRDKLMEIAREIYILSWLKSHWDLTEDFFQNQEIEDTIRNELRRPEEVFLRLIKKFNISSLFLLIKKIRNLNKLLEFDDKGEDRFNKVRYVHAREKQMFERTFNKLKGK